MKAKAAVNELLEAEPPLEHYLDQLPAKDECPECGNSMRELRSEEIADTLFNLGIRGIMTASDKIRVCDYCQRIHVARD